MIYIKYTDRDDLTRWSIYAHEKGCKEETMILAYTGSTHPDKMTLNLKKDRQDYKIEYLIEKEVDLLKLELL